MDYLAEPWSIPEVIIPEPVRIPVPTLEIPRADVPSYVPLVVPPSDLRAPEGVKGPNQEEEPVREAPKTPTVPPIPQMPQEMRTVDIPGTDYSIPVPTNEILVTAGTTATVSVAATLTATAIFKRLVSLMKPIIKKILTKKKKNEQD